MGKTIWRHRIQENPSSDPTGGACSATTNPIWWGGLAVPSPRTPSPALGPWLS